VVLARSTQAVRYHIERGRIPANSRVRRSTEEKWQSLEGTPDFADLLAPPAPPDASNMGADGNGRTPTLGKSNVDYRVFGVGALVNELFNAIDLSLHRHKLWTTVLAAMVWAVGLIGLRLVFDFTEGPWKFGLAALIGVMLLFVGGLAASAVAQMTLVEMLHRRRAHWGEIRPRLFTNAWNILLSQGLFLMAIWLPMQGLGHFREFFRDSPPEALMGTVLTLHLVLEIFFVPLAGLGLLLAPIIVVEECSFRKALGMWWELLRGDLSRTFLYETLAVALGMVLSSPLFIPVIYAGWSDQALLANPHLAAVSQATLHVLGGLAVTPFAAYLVVANVFIYLNMRYEFYSPNR
jgi:hypothetical protein